MCGRFALDQETNQLIDTYLVTHNRFPDWAPRWNIAPTSTIPLIIDVAESPTSVARIFGPARWSLTPSWSDTLQLTYPTFNARSESAAHKPAFRQSVAHHRGLIPATAYYEWQQAEGAKVPYAVRSTEGDLLSLAALYSTWQGAEGPVVTATILTRQAPQNLSWLHDRSPLPLPPHSWDQWLSPHQRGDDQLLQRAHMWSEEVLVGAEAYPVKPLTGDHPGLLSAAH